MSKPKSDECDMGAPLDPTADPVAARLRSSNCPPPLEVPTDVGTPVLRQVGEEPMPMEGAPAEPTELAGPPGPSGLAPLIKMLELVMGGLSLGLYYDNKDTLSYSTLATSLNMAADSFAIFIGLMSVLTHFGILGGKPSGPEAPADGTEAPLDPNAPVAVLL